MFTRFSTRRRLDAPPGGLLVSLVAHVAIVIVTSTGPLEPSADGEPEGDVAPQPFAATAVGERVQWVGTPEGTGDEARAGAGAPRPVAYVVPGRGALRLVPAGTVVPRRSPRAQRDGAPVPPPPPRRVDPERLTFLQRELQRLPDRPEVDVALLVAGTIASAPDLSRVVSRADDFRRVPPTEMASLIARTDIQSTSGPQALSHVDVLPIALVTNPMPVYPATLVQERVEGRVLVEFTIDTSGSVDLASLEVVRSTHTLLTQAVRAVIPQFHFLPAQLGRQTVGIRVRQPFEFVVR